MFLLSIGNSFSQDAHKWLPAIARSNGAALYAANLYVGGCSLEQHWDFFRKEEAAYDLEVEGMAVRKISIQEALTLQPWDVITFQQASHFSGQPETYFPYLSELVAQAKKACPQAKIYLHQTWAYAPDSTHSGFAAYQNDQSVMYRQLTLAYQKAAEAIGAPVLPVGTLIQRLRQQCPAFAQDGNGEPLTRDGFHLSWLYGRYAAALVWYCVLFDRPVPPVSFLPTQDGLQAREELLTLIHQAVESLLSPT